MLSDTGPPDFVNELLEIAKLDAASEVGLAYPYWHQRQFVERNPLPIAA